MLSSEGFVVEGTGDNVFIIKDGAVITPPPYLGILKGITRDAVVELALAAGLRVSEDVFTRHDVYNADECFLTGTAAEIIPVIEADGRVIGKGIPGPITQRLMKDFRSLTLTTGTPVYPEES